MSNRVRTTVQTVVITLLCLGILAAGAACGDEQDQQPADRETSPAPIQAGVAPADDIQPEDTGAEDTGAAEDTRGQQRKSGQRK